MAKSLSTEFEQRVQDARDAQNKIARLTTSINDATARTRITINESRELLTKLGHMATEAPE